MAASTATKYQNLELRPGSNYRQLFLKGRRIRAAVVHEAVHGPDPYTPEEFAREYGVPTVVGKAGAAGTLHDGDVVEVDGSTGEVVVIDRPGSPEEVAA